MAREADDRCEHYTYMGRTGYFPPVQFYAHEAHHIQSSRTQEQMAGDLYNLQIHDEVLDRDETIVVYNVAGPAPYEVRPVIVRHATFAETVFPPGILERTYERLLDAAREKGEATLAPYVMVSADGKRPLGWHQRVLEDEGAAEAEQRLARLPRNPKFAPPALVLSIKPIDHLDEELATKGQHAQQSSGQPRGGAARERNPDATAE